MCSAWEEACIAEGHAPVVQANHGQQAAWVACCVCCIMLCM